MDFRLYSVAMLVGLMAACAPGGGIDQDEEDIEDSEDQREPIVGGTTTSAYPAVGALTYFGSTHCTGTVVAPRLVVTAAHCVYGFSAGNMKFVLGSKVSQPSAKIGVVSIQAHPSYDEDSISNDIGIVVLASDAPVTPMKMVTSMDNSWVGRQLTFVGYGVSNGIQQTGAGTKRVVKMPIEGVYPTQFEYGLPGKNTCNGDSGGPAFAEVNGELLLAGVTSYGDANCTQYGVDTRVDAFASFIGVSNTPPTSDPCNGETWEGRCDGKKLIYCDQNETVKQLTCTNSCYFNAQQAYYDCK
ncbi:MAG: serine protease [Polyangiaceae bacterium]|nr:serine protease [Polyangiaceae bacterium]